MRFINLTTVSDQYQAQYLKEALEENGIQCIVANEITSQWIGTTIQVRVPKQNLIKAIEVYTDLKAQTDKVICPNCESDQVEFVVAKKYRKWWGLIIVSLLISPVLPPPNLIHVYSCKVCRTEFKKNKY